MTSASKNVYIDNWADIVNKYNNTYHNRTKMKPVHLKSNIYIDFSNKNKKEVEAGDHVRISE